MTHARQRGAATAPALAALATLALLVATLASPDLWRAMRGAPGVFEPLAFALAGVVAVRASTRHPRVRGAVVAAIGALALIVVPAGDWLATGLLAGGATLLAWPWTASLPRGRATLSALLGLVVLGAVVGWLLPYRLHYAPVYVAALAALAAWRRRAIPEVVEYARRRLLRAWRAAGAFDGRASTAIGVALGVTSWLMVAAGMPRVQFDDVYHHLWLPHVLADRGAHSFDAGNNAWAVAPWLSDVWIAMLMLVKGGEPRALLNWLALLATARFVWLLATAGRAGGGARWLALLCLLTVPVGLQVMHGTQTEMPSTALVAALTWLIAARFVDRTTAPAPADWAMLGIVAGGLAGMKTSNVLLELPLLALALHAMRPSTGARWSGPIGAAAVAIAVGASSYVYAWAVTGNPVYPLFNAVFRSPFFDTATNLGNSLYSGKFGLSAPYDFVFRSSKMGEVDGPIGGFQLAVLLPLAILSLRRSRLPMALLAATAAGAIALFSQQQYIRYMYPAMPIIAVAIGSGARALLLARVRWQLATLAVAAGAAVALNLAVTHRSMWIFRAGLVARSPLAGAEAPQRFEREIAGEKLIAARMRTDPDFRSMRVLAPFMDAPFVATFGAQALWGAWQNNRLAGAIADALADPSGERLRAELLRSGATHLLYRALPDQPAWRAVVSTYGELQMREGAATLVRLRLGAPLAAREQSPDRVSMPIPAGSTVPAAGAIADLRLTLRCERAGAALPMIATARFGDGGRAATWLGTTPCAGPEAVRFERAFPLAGGAIALEVEVQGGGATIEAADVRLRPDVTDEHALERRVRPPLPGAAR